LLSADWKFAQCRKKFEGTLVMGMLVIVKDWGVFQDKKETEWS
jgi:hypothetical protein